MVGNAAERLERDDRLHALLGISHDFGRQQPAFAELHHQRQDFLYVRCQLEHILGGAEIREAAHHLVEIPDPAFDQRIAEIQ